jgi:hypothetical protein
MEQSDLKQKCREYGIDLDAAPEFAEAMIRAIEAGHLKDSGRKRFSRGQWRPIWVKVPDPKR